MTTSVASAQGVFQPGFEGEIWEALPPVGRQLQCAVYDAVFEEWIPGPSCPSHPLDASTIDQFLYPFDVAVYSAPSTPLDPLTGFPTGYRLYVADSYNYRVLVFQPASDGAGGVTWAPVALPGAEWTWQTISTGPGTVAGGLSYVSGIATDDVGNVYVSDQLGNRIVMFDSSGQYLAERALPRTANADFIQALDVRDNQIAVVTINGTSQISSLHILEVGTLAVLSTYSAPRSDAPGGLAGATGVAFDASGRVVVADYENSRIQVFQVNASGQIVDAITNAPVPYQPTNLVAARPVLAFGRPAQPNNRQIYELQTPFSVAVDSRGRILVSDTDNQRLAVFMPNYSTSPPTATFLFQLNRDGGLDGYPRGLVEDAFNRLIVADTVNHEIEVFSIPDIAVVDESVTPSQVQPQSNFTAQFVIVVPETRQPASAVTPACSSPGATLVSGPSVVAGTLLPGDVLNPLAAIRISCEFVVNSNISTEEIAVTLAATAAGSTGDATVLQVPVGCAGCETDPPVVSASLPNGAVNGFYRSTVPITVTANDNGPGRTGVRRIYWRWINGPMVFETPASPCPASLTPVAESGWECTELAQPYPRTASIVTTATVDGSSVLEFFAMDGVLNRSARSLQSVAIDRIAPDIAFGFALVAVPNPAGWWNASLTVPLSVLDLQTPSADIALSTSSLSLLFDQEGQNLSQPVSATDLAGNTRTVSSSDHRYGGRFVNLDKTQPLTAAQTLAGGAFAGALSNTPVTFRLNANDNLSGVQWTKYALNGATSLSESMYTSPDPITISHVGVTNVLFWSRDLADNDETPRTIAIDINGAPLANDDLAISAEDATTPIAVLSNDSDPNGVAADPLRITHVTQPLLGTVTFTATSIVFQGPSQLAAPATTTFTYTLSDRGGLSDTATVTITLTPVDDPANSDPICTAATASLAEIWPPNHQQFAEVQVLGVNDPDGDPFSITITGIFQDEPVEGKGDGMFAVDAAGVGESSAWVRAERKGSGDGRVYEIKFTATDLNGARCSASVFTVVPKSRGVKWSAVNSGTTFNSTIIP